MFGCRLLGSQPALLPKAIRSIRRCITNVASPGLETKTANISSLMNKFSLICGTTVGVGAAAFVYGAHRAEMPLPLFYTHAMRFARTAITGAIITADYKWSFRHLERGQPEYNEMRKIVGLRTAKRILELCKANRGIYIKAGQHIASMNHVLPAEFTQTLSVLQDQAASRPYEDVVQAFQNELGIHPNEIFDNFERQAVAAASLAQVHKAQLRETGKQVAVKVQYPDMDDMFRGDIKTIEIMMNLIGRSFPSFQFSWLLPDFKSALESELDFVNEAKNSERAARLFGSNPNLYIPKVEWKATTKRILTMEWVDGVKINDVDGIKSQGFDLDKVARTLIDLLSEQIFIHGFIHSDPHPGNILVRPNPTSKGPQVVLLDHGLYQTFPDDLRVPYCKLWRALLVRNRKDIEKYGRMLGAGEYYNLLSIILTFRPIEKSVATPCNAYVPKISGLTRSFAYSRDVGLKSQMSPEDIQQIRSIFKGKTPQENMQMVNDLLESLPRELLLVLRTTNLLRAANKDLGATVNRFLVMAKWSLKGAHSTRSGESMLFSEKLSYAWDLTVFEVMIHVFEWSRWCISVAKQLSSWISPSKEFVQPLAV